MRLTTKRVNYDNEPHTLDRYTRSVYAWYDPEDDKTGCLEDLFLELFQKRCLEEDEITTITEESIPSQENPML